MEHWQIVKAIEILTPEAIYALSDVDYENIIWENTKVKKPTLAEIEAIIETLPARIAAEAAAKEAARQALLDKLGITADEAKLLLG